MAGRAHVQRRCPAFGRSVCRLLARSLSGSSGMCSGPPSSGSSAGVTSGHGRIPGSSRPTSRTSATWRPATWWAWWIPAGHFVASARRAVPDARDRATARGHRLETFLVTQKRNFTWASTPERLIRKITSTHRRGALFSIVACRLFTTQLPEILVQASTHLSPCQTSVAS